VIETIFGVLVNWNLKEDTIACIESLRAAGMRDGQIVVVDNDSQDDSTVAITNWFQDAVIQIRSDRNLGFTGGANLGLAYALEHGAEWVFLLNNDTHVSPMIFTEFSRAAAETPHFDILAPIIFYHEQPERIWYFGDRLIDGTLLTRGIYRNQGEPVDLPRIQAVDFVSGCGMLIHRVVLETIGMFDTSLFMYGEEVDFCWRARLHGFRFGTVRGAKMWHRVSTSADKIPVKKRYFKTRNQCHFYNRYGSLWLRLFLIGYTFLRSVIMGGASIIRREDEPILPYLNGWFDGWFRYPHRDAIY
jgi:GT2 family glycosyltransferase